MDERIAADGMRRLAHVYPSETATAAREDSHVPCHARRARDNLLFLLSVDEFART
jgi:hypothetical protein